MRRNNRKERRQTDKENRRTRCYSYIRVSTDMQVDGYSLDAQRERLAKYAAYQDWEIVREYCDAGKSGKSIAGRPEFTKMLHDVSKERDGVDFILVFKLSRFGRNAADVLSSLQHIQDYGVNLVCVEDGIDSSKESGKLTITVLSAVAEIERENILIQTMEGRRQKAREGKWNGGTPPFGYILDKEKDVLVINPEEAEIVKTVYRLFVHSYMGMDAIAEYLNEHGYSKNRYRGQDLSYFTRSLIVKILDNPVYIGKISYGRTKTEKVKGKRDEYHRIKMDEYLLVDGKHEAIIDEETWNAARKRREETGLPWVKTYSLGHEHILSGLIKCPVCGLGMSGMTNRHFSKKTGENKDRFYYRCLHRGLLDDGSKCSFNHSYRQEKLNAEVEQIVLDIIKDEAFHSEILKDIGEAVDVEKLETEIMNLREQLRQVEGAKEKLLEQVGRLDPSDRHYNRKFSDMQDRLDSLYDRIDDIEDNIRETTSKIENVASQRITAESLCKILDDFEITYDNMTDLEKKQFFRNFIRAIEIYPDETEDGRILKRIDFKFPVRYDLKEEKALCGQNTEETVVLLSRKTEKPKTFFDISVEAKDYYRIKDRKKN